MKPRKTETINNTGVRSLISTRWFAFALFCSLLTVQSSFAQGVTFNASVNSTQVALGEQFQITFTLSGGSLKQYTDFRQPDMNANFLTLMGPSTSQQMQIINGKVSTSISWTYVLQPRNVGSFTISSASLKYDGQTLKSNPITIKVTAAAPGSAGKGQKKDEGSGDVNIQGELFIRAIADKRKVYLGEPITVTYKLYSRVAFQVDNPIKLPRMVGFWSEDIETPKQLRPEIEVYNGKKYQTFLVRKVVYFPTQSGTLTIDQFEINATVKVRQKRKSGDDFFDKFFGDPFFDSYKDVKKTILTEKVNVDVKPLPTDNQPASFKGSVGSYSMQATIDKSKLKANETATIKVVIRGTGNIRLLEPPAMEMPNGVDKYDPKISEEVQKSTGKIGGVKTFEYLIIPRYPGQVTIPAVEFSYFDYSTKKYVTEKSKEFMLDVDKADVRLEAAGTDKAPVDYLTMDIQPLKKNLGATESSTANTVPFGMMMFLYILPLAAAAGGIAWKKRHDALHGDVAGLKMRRATKAAEKHLASSRKYLEANKIDEYYLEIARALWGYMQHKLKIPTSETSIEFVVDSLGARNVKPELQDEVRSALHAVDFARFSPTRATREEMDALYTSSKSAIISVEQALRG